MRIYDGFHFLILIKNFNSLLPLGYTKNRGSGIRIKICLWNREFMVFFNNILKLLNNL